MIARATIGIPIFMAPVKIVLIKFGIESMFGIGLHILPPAGLHETELASSAKEIIGKKNIEIIKFLSDKHAGD